MIEGRRRLDACLFFMPRFLYPALVLLFVCAFFPLTSPAQTAKKTPDGATSGKQAMSLAKTGHCKEALPGLKRAAQHDADAALKRDAGFAGVRCAMAIGQTDAALDFLRFLKREFPRDPDLLYLAVHTYSDLSTRASLELATTAPTSPEAHQLNAEALEVQGKWDEAEKEYRVILAQNPNMPGIHYRLGRILLSRPDFSPAMAEQAKGEFQQELAIIHPTPARSMSWAHWPGRINSGTRPFSTFAGSETRCRLWRRVSRPGDVAGDGEKICGSDSAAGNRGKA